MPGPVGAQQHWSVNSWSSLLGQLDVFVEEKDILPRTGFSHKETSSATKDPPQDPQSSKVMKECKQQLLCSFTRTQNSHRPSAAAGISVEYTNIWPKQLGRDLWDEELLQVLGDGMKALESWISEKRKGTGQDCWEQIKRGSAYAALFLGCYHRWAPSFPLIWAIYCQIVGNLQNVRHLNSLPYEVGMTIFPLKEFNYKSCSPRIQLQKINEEPSLVPIVACTITSH